MIKIWMIQKYLRRFNFIFLGAASVLLMLTWVGFFLKQEVKSPILLLEPSLETSSNAESVSFNEPILGGISQKKEEMEIQFLGTAIAGDKIFAVLSYHDRQFLVQEGETIQDWKIKHLSGSEVILENKLGKTLRCFRQSSKEEWAPSIQNVGDHHHKLDQASLKNILSHWAQLLTQVRMIPLFQDGQAQGYELLNVKPDSMVQKLGFKTGDIIRKINGHEVTDLTALFSLKDQIQGEDLIIDVKRGAKEIQLIYEVEESLEASNK